MIAPSSKDSILVPPRSPDQLNNPAGSVTNWDTGLKDAHANKVSNVISVDEKASHCAIALDVRYAHRETTTGGDRSCHISHPPHAGTTNTRIPQGTTESDECA